MWAHCNELSPYLGRWITEYLNANYQGSWIQQGGPVAWLSMSSGLILLYKV